ncbi:MAG: amino acid permease, partial [Planctomycetota bacterium]
MSDAKPHALAKTLGLLDIYAITTAGFFSAGFFVLPALAFEVGGPAAVFAYPLAAILMAPSMLSIAELATALPRA